MPEVLRRNVLSSLPVVEDSLTDLMNGDNDGLNSDFGTMNENADEDLDETLDELVDNDLLD